MIEIILGGVLVVLAGGSIFYRTIKKSKEQRESEQNKRQNLIDNQNELRSFLKKFHESSIIRDQQIRKFKQKYRKFYENYYKHVIFNPFDDIKDEDFELLRILFLSGDSFKALEQRPLDTDDLLDEVDVNDFQSLLTRHNNEAANKYFDQDKNKQLFTKFIERTYEHNSFLTKSDLRFVRERFEQLYEHASWLGEDSCCNNSQLCISVGKEKIKNFFYFYKNQNQFLNKHNLSIAQKLADASANKINHFDKALNEKKFIRKADAAKLKKEYQDTYNAIIPLKDNKTLGILLQYNCTNDVINIFINFFEDTDKLVEEHNKRYLLTRFDDFEKKFINRDEYIDKTKSDHLEKEFQSDRQDILDGKHLCPPERRKIYDQFEEFFKDKSSSVKKHNDDFIEKSIKKHQSFFQNIDGKELDEDQQRAVIIDEISNLIVAGAGCGKTLTIVGKVKYLCEICNVRPEEIAVFSFSKKAVQEMQERLKNAGIPVDEKEKIDSNQNIKKSGVTVRTFHSYALSFVRNSQQLNSKLLDECIAEWTKINLATNQELVDDLYKYFACHLNPEETKADLEDVTCLGDYYQKQKRKNLKPIKSFIEYDDRKQRPRNQFELDVSNYLFEQNIHYELTDGDFMLKDKITDQKIHLNVLPLPPSKYVQLLSDAEQKKEQNKKNKLLHQKDTTIIDLVPVDENGLKFERRLSEELAHYQLVTEHPINKTKIVQNILSPKDANNKNNRDIEYFQTLIKTCIDRFRIQGRGIEDVKKIIIDAEKEGDDRKKCFYKIVKNVYQHFEDYKKEKNEIDFTDVIINFIDAMDRGFVNNIPFTYIIVDEFQDIDSMQYKMLTKMKELSGAKLMCVGDDWQSIYRFRGSNLSYFNNFQEFFGTHVRQDIKTTYRNSQRLLDVTGSFIQQNKFQLTKELKSKSKDCDTPIILFKYMHNKDALDCLSKALSELPSDSKECLILGRYTEYVNIFKNRKDMFQQKTKKEEDGIWVGNWKKRPEIEITYMTVHKSKGLQSENVIIWELKNDYKGFPSQMEDDPVLKPSESPEIRNSDNYPFSEERRLFYVAMSRTKNHIYLIGPAKTPSIFMEEIKDIAEKQEKTDPRKKLIRIETIGVDDGKPAPKCPKCKTGLLIAKKNEQDNSHFIGCTNYPSCDYKNNSIEILKETNICPACGDYLIKRKGKYGYFLGCSNYSDTGCTGKSKQTRQK